MHRAYCWQAWDHTAALMTLIANMVPTKGRERITYESMHPFLRQQQPVVPRKPFSHLREVLNGNGQSDKSR